MSTSSELLCEFFFFSSRRRHTRLQGDWSSDVCSSDLDVSDISSLGTLPSGGWLLVRTGWTSSSPGSPGFTVAGAQMLASSALTGVGVETIGTDAGAAHSFDPPFPCHNYMLGAGKHGLTQLANLSLLPASGF